MSSTLPVTPLSQLASYIDKQQVVCIEGKIVAVYPKKEGEGQYGKWVMQDVNLSQDGVEHKITIGDDKKLLSEADKGKSIRLSAGTDKKGQLSGLQYEVKSSGDKVYRKVKVGAWANLEFLGASGEPVKPSGGGNTQSAAQRTTGGNASYSGPAGRNGAQVGNAINNAALLMAHGIIKLDEGNNPMAALEGVAKGILALADRLEKTPVSQPTEPVVMGWKNALHPNGKKLGELDDGSLKKAIKWAYANPSPKEADKITHSNLLLAAAELGHDYASLLVEEGADPVGLEKLVQKNFEKSVGDLTRDEAAQLFKNVAVTVQQAGELANELGDSDLSRGDDFDDIPF